MDFNKIEGVDFTRNANTQEAKKMANSFIDCYPFLKKDNSYIEFIKKINGLEIANSNYFIIIYGFALLESELVFSLATYINDSGYLFIVGYTEKRLKNTWKGIVFYYHKDDENPIIYAKFHAEINDKNKYYPFCIGFKNLISIITTMDYQMQYQMAVKSP